MILVVAFHPVVFVVQFVGSVSSDGPNGRQVRFQASRLPIDRSDHHTGRVGNWRSIHRYLSTFRFFFFCFCVTALYYISGLAIRNVGKVNDHYDDAIFWILPDENPEEIEGNANRLPPSNDIVMSVNNKD